MSLAKHIAEKTAKKRGPVARARAGGEIATASAEKLSKLLDRHLPRAVQAWVDGLSATKIEWDNKQQKYIDTGIPDHRERRENATKIVEYVVGRAIERSMAVSGSYEDLDKVIERLRTSPEAQRLIKGGFFDDFLAPENSEHSTSEGDQRT